LQDDPAVARLLAAIGKSLRAQGRGAEAVDELRAAVGRVPNDLTVQTELGRTLWQLGHQQAAIAVLTGVLAIDGNAPEALRARGEIFADMGDAENALRDLDRVRHQHRPSIRRPVASRWRR
jgi:tetratricopeptide (TPR) repeat protein